VLPARHTAPLAVTGSLTKRVTVAAVARVASLAGFEILTGAATSHWIT